MDVTYELIKEAADRIADAIFLTPTRKSTLLSQQTGGLVYLKLDNLQMTGSFKERGARNKLMSLSEEERARGVIAASAGNHAQAVAHHGSMLGIDTKIVMPEGTPLIKVERTKNFGGKVVLAGQNYDASYQVAKEIEQNEGRVFVHPFDDPHVICGQGTIGLEIADQLPDVDIVVVAIGGGGLASGVGVAIKTLLPNVQVIGVEPDVLPSMRTAIAATHPVEIPSAQTLADGIAVRRVGDLTTQLCTEYVDQVVTVSESEIARAILVLLEQEKTLAEGAGAASLAAIMAQKFDFQGKKVCAVICGGNIDVNVISRIIEHGLVAAGRLTRIPLQLTDTPGSLASALSLVGSMKANILEVLHNRTFTSGEAFGTTNVELKIETKGEDHIEEIRARLKAEGFVILDHL